MCRALRVLCAAPTPERLGALKRAAVSAHWELVGGATSLDELLAQLSELSPDVVVVEGLGPEVARRVREEAPRARVVGVGRLEGADGEASSLEGVRDAILGVPRPGGPVVGT